MKPPKLRTRKCNFCKNEFMQQRPLQYLCGPTCAAKYAIRNTAEANYRANVGSKKELKERLKTRTDWLNEVQVIFNEFIRLRDCGLPCISCGNNNEVKWNAGHYRSVGGNPEIRFHELNVHKQCEYCNTYLHGNLIEYRKGLIKKIGPEFVELLEGPQVSKHYSIPELIELKVIYKDKIKRLKNQTKTE